VFENEPLVGLVLVTGALLAAWIAGRAEERAANELDRAWLDFRDAYGLLWGLRLQERINAVAQQNGWNVELTWSGFRSPQSGESVSEFEPAIEAGLRAAMRGVLRRFGTPGAFNAAVESVSQSADSGNRLGPG
jgi:hypothetical protein